MDGYPKIEGKKWRLGTSVILLIFSSLTPALTATESSRRFIEWQYKGSALLRSGNYSAATQAFRHAIALAKPATTSSSDLVELHTALAYAYNLQARYAESKDEFRDALSLVAESQGANSLDYAVVFAGMSLLPTASENQTKAIDLLRKAIAQNASTESERELTVARDYLARVLLSEKQYKAANVVLEDWQSSLDARNISDPELKSELFNDLAVLRHHEKHYSEALDLEVQAIGLLRQALGNNHPALLVPLNNVAILYAQLNCLDEADATFNQAAKLCAELLGPSHPTYASILANHAVVLKKLGHKREGKRMEAIAKQILQASNRSNGVGATISLSALRSGDR